MSRETLLEILAIIGPDFHLADAKDGWPGIVLLLGHPPVPLAMHVGAIGLSHRRRDQVERRFQNPGQNRPLSAPEGAVPLLVGLWEETSQPVLVAMDASRRMSRRTRQSLFVRLSELQNAATRGWSEYTNTAGEHIYLFHPTLFATYARLQVGMAEATDAEEIQDLIAATGITQEGRNTAEERVRRITAVLSRRATFTRDVIDAYDGRCAMCGIDLGLVEAAHIFPVSAPGSVDIVPNGIALCRNHHGAFDQHKIWISPQTGQLRVNGAWLTAANADVASRAFFGTILRTLRRPRRIADNLDPRFLRFRYRYFTDKYAWATRQR